MSEPIARLYYAVKCAEAIREGGALHRCNLEAGHAGFHVAVTGRDVSRVWATTSHIQQPQTP